MITEIKNRLQRLKTDSVGQHLTEFLLMFLAVSVAFVGMQLYLRRGVNAKLKHVEIQLNEAVSATEAIASEKRVCIDIQVQGCTQGSHGGWACFELWSWCRTIFDSNGRPCSETNQTIDCWHDYETIDDLTVDWLCNTYSICVKKYQRNAMHWRLKANSICPNNCEGGAVGSWSGWINLSP